MVSIIFIVVKFYLFFTFLYLLGRAFMGLGCSICLMGSLVLISRWADRDEFSKLAGVILAVGGVGGLLATTPLSYVSDLYGWRLSFWVGCYTIMARLGLKRSIYRILILTFLRMR